MPKTNASGEPIAEELPATIRRSPRKAREIFAKAHDSAAEEYGEEDRAYRVAYAAVKQEFRKVGDHWEEKGS
jgi:cation transport regulator ChaB